MARIASGATISSSCREDRLLDVQRLHDRLDDEVGVARSASSVVRVIRPSSSACSSSVSLPRLTARPVEFSRCCRPRSTASSSSSTPMTSNPLRAKTSAMPAPMVPSPMTPMVEKVRAEIAAGAGHGGDHVRAPDPRAVSKFTRVDCTPVRLVVARCQVDYAGRLTAHLPMATRVLMLKADGSVLVHSDGGSYKPLNWMSPPCTVREGTHRGRSAGVGGHQPHRRHAAHPDRGDPPRLLPRPRARSRACEGRRREAPPGAAGRAPGDAGRGPDPGAPGVPDGDRAGRPDVPGHGRHGGGRGGQAPRGDRRGRAADPLPRAAQPRPAAVAGAAGIFAAQEIKPQARVLATDRGIACAVVDYDALRGMDDSEHRLF